MLVDKIGKAQDFIYAEFPPGPKEFMEMRHIINFFKGATVFYIVLLMWWYQNFSTGMYLYLGLHGSYGMAWLFKDFVFGDKSFTRRASIGSLIVLSTALTLYWMVGWFIASGRGIQEPSYERVKVCLITYLLGLAVMIGSDAQKTFTLQYRKGLIDQGYFDRTRNPNYLGEVMIYGSFALASGFWLSWAIMLMFWLVLFLSNMLLKDYNSLMKKPGWEQYSARSYMFLPRIFSSHALNAIVYVTAAGLLTAKFHGWTYTS